MFYILWRFFLAVGLAVVIADMMFPNVYIAGELFHRLGSPFVIGGALAVLVMGILDDMVARP